MKTTLEESAIIASQLGFEVSSSFKFHVFSKDTEDFSINKRTGNFKCWTGAWDGGDAISFVMFIKNCSFLEAKEFVLNTIDKVDTFEFRKFNTNTNYLSADEKEPIPDEYMNDYIAYGDEYFSELKNLFAGEVDGKQLPVCNFDAILNTAKRFEIKFVEKSQRLIMPIRDINNKISTFWKYKKYGEVFVNSEGKEIKHRKVLFSKERHRPPFAISQMIEYRKNKEDFILITEGEKDALVAYANGIKAICIGGAGASTFLKEEYLELFRDMKVILAGDYDEAGEKFNSNLKQQLESIVKSIVILDWKAKSKKEGFNLFDKFDLADYFAWKYSRKIKLPDTKFISTLPTMYNSISYESKVEFPFSW